MCFNFGRVGFWILWKCKFLYSHVKFYSFFQFLTQTWISYFFEFFRDVIGKKAREKRKYTKKQAEPSITWTKSSQFTPKVGECTIKGTEFKHEKLCADSTPFQILKLFITQDILNIIFEESIRFVSVVKKVKRRHLGGGNHLLFRNCGFFWELIY